ncbi:MAG: hypothetical protein JF614_21430 [Acidobacteria bacterium]|nr:hypothetical protein [Acidobacteriota bacterium]
MLTAKKAESKVTYSAHGISAAALQETISEQLGIQFVFVASKSDDVFDVELDRVSATDLLTGLAKHGAAAFRAPQKAERPLGAEVSFKAEKAQAATVVKLLQELGGEGVSLSAADPTTLVTLDVEQVSLSELRLVLSKSAGIRVGEDGRNP